MVIAHSVLQNDMIACSVIVCLRARLGRAAKGCYHVRLNDAVARVDGMVRIGLG